jgi:hypothetical protein
MNDLEYHQVRLLISSIKRSVRIAAKVGIDTKTGRHHIAIAQSLTGTLILKLERIS